MLLPNFAGIIPEHFRKYMVRIRLKQQGKKGQKSYRIVIMDSERWRNGETIEDIGFYDPIQNPSTIKLDQTKYESWLAKGAQPSDTVKAIAKNFFEKK